MKSRLIVIAIIASLITGCGFHLRHHYLLNNTLNPAYVSFNKSYSEFNLIFLETLQHNGLQLVDSANDANSQIHVKKVTLTHNERTRGPSNQSQVYSYRLTVTLDVIDSKGNKVKENIRASASERLALRPNQLIHTNNQLSDVKRKLYYRIAELLVMKLR